MLLLLLLLLSVASARRLCPLPFVGTFDSLDEACTESCAGGLLSTCPQTYAVQTGCTLAVGTDPQYQVCGGPVNRLVPQPSLSSATSLSLLSAFGGPITGGTESVSSRRLFSRGSSTSPASTELDDAILRQQGVRGTDLLIAAVASADARDNAPTDLLNGCLLSEQVCNENSGTPRKACEHQACCATIGDHRPLTCRAAIFCEYDFSTDRCGYASPAPHTNQGSNGIVARYTLSHQTHFEPGVWYRNFDNRHASHRYVARIASVICDIDATAATVPTSCDDAVAVFVRNKQYTVGVALETPPNVFLYNIDDSTAHQYGVHVNEDPAVNTAVPPLGDGRLIESHMVPLLDRDGQSTCATFDGNCKQLTTGAKRFVCQVAILSNLETALDCVYHYMFVDNVPLSVPYLYMP